MSKQRFHKSDIARCQLEMATRLFLNGEDLSSVITLAGASSGILDRLVLNAGMEPFVDYACRVRREMSGQTPKRQTYSHHINKQIGVIVHKHLAAEEAETVELDLDKMAFDALTRALTDYVKLNGQEEPFVKAFYQWAWESTDGRVQMEEYKKVPDRLRPT